MAGVEIFRDPGTRGPYPMDMRMGHKVCMAVRKHGVILRNLSDVIVILPPLTVTLTELDHIIESLEKSIREICG
jgi:adenosylmethionine-8-amino-7-oxononanoate aminotransferase